MKLMHDMYEDLYERLFNRHTYPIYDTEYWLYVESGESYRVIGLKDLKVLPRVGEKFNIAFTDPELHRGKRFQVNEVIHDLENGIHRISIYLIDRIKLQ